MKKITKPVALLTALVLCISSLTACVDVAPSIDSGSSVSTSVSTSAGAPVSMDETGTSGAALPEDSKNAEDSQTSEDNQTSTETGASNEPASETPAAYQPSDEDYSKVKRTVGTYYDEYSAAWVVDADYEYDELGIVIAFSNKADFEENKTATWEDKDGIRYYKFTYEGQAADENFDEWFYYLITEEAVDISTGLVLSTTTVNGSTETFKYDEKGRNIYYKCSDSMMGCDNIIENRYDEDGNLIRVFSDYDGDINETTIEYVNGKVKRETYSSDGEAYSFEYEYDLLGNLLTTTYHSDESEHVAYSYEYNEKGQKIRMNSHNIYGVIYSSTYITYDEAGNEIEQLVSSDFGTTTYMYKTEYKYDDRGNIIYNTYSMDNGTGVFTLSYETITEYDDHDNMTYQKYTSPYADYETKIVNTYDDRGRLTKFEHYNEEGGLESYTTYEYFYN